MNVKCSDNISNLISNLRQNIYTNINFQQEFERNLKCSIFATQVVYVPNQFGGWDVNVCLDRNKGIKNGIESQESYLYISKVSSALWQAIHSISKTIIPDNIDSIINIIISGPESIIIKL